MFEVIACVKNSRERITIKINANIVGACFCSPGVADARFILKSSTGAELSVYLDLNDNLGCMGKPYWEVHDGQCYRFDKDDITGLEQCINNILN